MFGTRGIGVFAALSPVDLLLPPNAKESDSAFDIHRKPSNSINTHHLTSAVNNDDARYSTSEVSCSGVAMIVWYSSVRQIVT